MRKSEEDIMNTYEILMKQYGIKPEEPFKVKLNFDGVYYDNLFEIRSCPEPEKFGKYELCVVLDKDESIVLDGYDSTLLSVLEIMLNGAGYVEKI